MCVCVCVCWMVTRNNPSVLPSDITLSHLQLCDGASSSSETWSSGEPTPVTSSSCASERTWPTLPAPAHFCAALIRSAWVQQAESVCFTSPGVEAEENAGLLLLLLFLQRGSQVVCCLLPAAIMGRSNVGLPSLLGVWDHCSTGSDGPAAFTNSTFTKICIIVFFQYRKEAKICSSEDKK